MKCTYYIYAYTGTSFRPPYWGPCAALQTSNPDTGISI